MSPSSLSNKIPIKTAIPILLITIAFFSISRISYTHLSAGATFEDYAFPSFYPSFSEYSVGRSSDRAKSPWTDPQMGSLHLTNFIAHSPGFSVIENLYWRNDTWYIVTDQPQLVPPLKYVSSPWTFSEADDTYPDGEPIQLLSLRSSPIGGDVSEQNQKGKTISLKEATEVFANAQVLDGITLVTTDNDFISHYYHWIGEMFLGAWRLWSNLAWRTGIEPPDFDRIVFMRQWSMAESPNPQLGSSIWEDAAGANAFFMPRFFPGATIETKKEWLARKATNKIYRFPRALLADRAGGHNGPSAGFKPFGDILRVPVNEDYLLTLRNRVLEGYKGTVNTRPSKLLKVLYLSRQDTGRKLADDVHEKLVEELKGLAHDGVVDLDIVQFTKDVSFEDQVATMVNVDVLIGVHGNGLTHILWMTPGKNKASFEMMPQDCQMRDYSSLAIANSIQHFLINGNNVCTPLECHIGCTNKDIPEYSSVHRNDIRVNTDLIIDEIRRMVAKRDRHM